MATPTTLPATFVSGNVLTAAELNDVRGAFRVLQVVSAIKTDTFTASTTTYTDITGISASITPSSSTSKIFILINLQGSNNTDVDTATLQLVRGSTAIALGTAAGSRIVGTSSLTGGPDLNVVASNIVAFLDSPATTSATTYKLQGRSNQSANAFFVNRSKSDADSAVSVRVVSTITLLEISA